MLTQRQRGVVTILWRSSAFLYSSVLLVICAGMHFCFSYVRFTGFSECVERYFSSIMRNSQPLFIHISIKSFHSVSHISQTLFFVFYHFVSLPYILIFSEFFPSYQLSPQLYLINCWICISFLEILSLKSTLPFQSVSCILWLIGLQSVTSVSLSLLPKTPAVSFIVYYYSFSSWAVTSQPLS